ncbi:MAG: bifunctional diaminohydroxyphosphoribosylaminopyrimidine deaminase/5-amino-6-(5-phosphoribosylamino)uracil reductase RibD [Acidobacteriota bacterium]
MVSSQHRIPRDERFMRRALQLARRGTGAVSPNPLVGAVVARGGRIVGEGYHRVFGGRHAEVAALRAAGARARGATLYTNLEPCAHHGKTPPCVETVVAAGIRRVVAAMRDPDRKVFGRGFRHLRRAGVEVVVGLLAADAARLNESFLHSVATGRPLVTLKAGMSLDGRIAAAGGHSRWITSPAAWLRAHRIRRSVDAVLVGVGTVVADDPRLTARPGGRVARCQPRRVVLDGRFRMPPEARLLAERGAGPVIIYGLDCQFRRRRRLEKAGAEVVTVPERHGQPDIGAVLSDLAGRGVQSLLVEGGGRVNGAFVEARMADRIAWFIAPRFLGAGGIPVLDGATVDDPADSVRIEDVTVARCGPDLLVEGRLVAGDRPGERRRRVQRHRQ